MAASSAFNGTRALPGTGIPVFLVISEVTIALGHGHGWMSAAQKIPGLDHLQDAVERHKTNPKNKSKKQSEGP